MVSEDLRSYEETSQETSPNGYPKWTHNSSQEVLGPSDPRISGSGTLGSQDLDLSDLQIL
jgi:hypothetical protein